MIPSGDWCMECANRCDKCGICNDRDQFRAINNPVTYTMIDIVEKDEYGLRNKKIKVNSGTRVEFKKSDWVPPFMRDLDTRKQPKFFKQSSCIKDSFNRG